MSLYIISFLYFAACSFSKNQFLKFCALIILITLIGLRYEVGADWGNYLSMYDKLSNKGILESLSYTDPAYGLLNYIGNYFGYGIWFVNLISGAIFSLCLSYFCKYLKNYWIGMLVAFPYIILAVSMGYTRQSVAIGLAMVAMVHLFKARKISFVVWLLAALTFHKSALLLFLFVPYVFNIRFSLIKNVLYFITFIALILIMMNKLSSQENLYFTDQVSSAGALARMIIHIPPIIIYLLFRSKFKQLFRKNIFVIDTFLVLILFFFTVSFYYSTFADRFNLYFYIFDMLVLSNITVFFERYSYYAYWFSIIIFQFILMFVWLKYSPWAQCCWLPYQNYLWIGLI